MQQYVGEKQSQALAARAFGNAYVLLVLTTLFWAGNSVVARGAVGLVPPFALAWLRWTMAAAIVMPFAWPYIRRDMPVISRHWPILSLLAALGTGSFVSLYYYGLSKTTAINGLIINSTVPILIPIAVFVFYRETLTRLQAAGIVLSMVGVLIVLTQGDLAVLATFQLNEGDLWALLAMMVWAVYTALLRKQPSMHWLSFAAISFVVASIVNFPLFLTEYLAGIRIQPSMHSYLAIAYVSIFPSILSQIFYIRSVGLIGGTRAGVFMHLIPLFGGIMAILFLGENLHLYHLAGFAIILSGVGLASRPARIRGSGESNPIA
jgi:drug/metabolite transporter (DMT)-like permease